MLMLDLLLAVRERADDLCDPFPVVPGSYRVSGQLGMGVQFFFLHFHHDDTNWTEQNWSQRKQLRPKTED